MLNLIHFVAWLEKAHVLGRRVDPLEALIKHIFEFRSTMTSNGLIELVLREAFLRSIVIWIQLFLIDDVFELRFLSYALWITDCLLLLIQTIFHVFLFEYEVCLLLICRVYGWLDCAISVLWNVWILWQVHSMAARIIYVVLLLYDRRIGHFSQSPRAHLTIGKLCILLTRRFIMNLLIGRKNCRRVIRHGS